MSLLNDFKLSSLHNLSKVRSISNNWQQRKQSISSYLNANNWGQSAFDLGDHLSDIFSTTTVGGRGQSAVSTAGAAWECLITWYLNLIFWDTKVVVLKQSKKFVPESIRNCLTVTISNVSTNTESDIVIFSVPDQHLLSGSTTKDLNDHLLNRINQVDLFVLQCKTNWEDNAQIPMLWDMIYNSQSRLPNVSIGIQGLSPQSVNNFKYGFATVPTGPRGNFIKTDSVKVLRVKNLTGGNYWGKATQQHLASSIKELPSRHFPSVFQGSIANHLSRIHNSQNHMIQKFLDLNFE